MTDGCSEAWAWSDDAKRARAEAANAMGKMRMAKGDEVMDGPYKVLEDARCPGLFSLHGPVGRMKSAMDQDDLLENADEFNEARRLAIEEAIGVVRKFLPFEMGDAIESDLRALAGQETKENP